jgi:hypothetical protein
VKKNAREQTINELDITKRVKVLAELHKKEETEIGKLARKVLSDFRRIEKAEKQLSRIEKLAAQEGKEKQLDRALKGILRDTRLSLKGPSRTK